VGGTVSQLRGSAQNKKKGKSGRLAGVRET